VNPVSIEIDNPNGQVTDQIQAGVEAITASGSSVSVTFAATTSAEISFGLPTGVSPVDALAAIGAFYQPATDPSAPYQNQSSYVAWTTYQYSHLQLVSTRVYYAIPTSGVGSGTANYNETDYGYNAVGNLEWTRTPDGTITWNVLSAAGLVLTTWQGTNDGSAASFQAFLAANPTATTGPSGTEMFRVADNQYDPDGDLTASTQYDGNGHSYATYYAYDWRDRQVAVLTPDQVATVTTYDNLDEDIEDQTYADATTYVVGTRLIAYSVGGLRAQTETSYDSQGNVYQSQTYNVNPVSGQTGDYLATNYWYDGDGNLLATQTGSNGAFQKYAYDGLGDQVESYVCYGAGDASAWGSAVSASYDTVIQQTQTFYDAAGEAVATATFEALPGASWSGPLLVMPNYYYSASDCYETGSATFYDGIGRDVEEVNYGHERSSDSTLYLLVPFNGSQSNLNVGSDGVPVVAEQNPQATDSSTNYLVSQTVYNAPTPAGQAVDAIDNAGIDDRTIYDPEGRVTRTIQDYTTGSGDFSGGIPAAGDTGKDVTTDYKYDSAGRLAAQVAYDAKGTTTVAEQTTYLYDCATDASLPTAVVAPDSTDTLTHNTTTGDWTITSGTDHTSTAYDWLGRTTTTTDQRGVTHTYTYDSAGRLAADTVSNFGNLPAAAQTVNEIATTYDDAGRVQTVTSYGLVGGVETVVNQVKEAYNGWGDLSREWQSPTGVVSGSTPSVQYDYADGSQGGGVAAYLRLTDVIYPNGRDVQYGYGAAGSTDDVLGQVATIAGSDGTYAAYTYLGVDTIVTEDYQQPQVKLDYTNGSGQITGLDRFGRVVDQVWSDYGNSTTVDEFKYGYDMSGNVAWKENVVSRGQSSPVDLDELYTYNGLDELTALARGKLNTTQSGLVSGTQDYSQSWTLDALGNWSSFDDNGATQTRQTDQSNEITSITGDTVNYDLAGNMTSMPQPGSANATLTCVYDAWDRLVQVSIGGTVTAQYQYDGADRLVSETASGTTTYSFYAGQSVIETRVGGTAASNVKYQYVWSLRGDAIPVLRDTYSVGTLQSASRIYYTTDANSSVTALIGLSGGTWIVIERYVYDAYGKSGDTILVVDVLGMFC
jgi:YD repeat-containing protein